MADRSTDLGRKVLGRRVPAGVVGRDVDEAVNVVLGNSLNDALRTVDVDVSVGEVPAQLLAARRLSSAHESLTWWDIDDRQGCRQHRNGAQPPRWTGCCASRIPRPRLVGQANHPIIDGSYNEVDTAKVTSDLQVSLRHLLTVGDDNGASLRSWKASIPVLPSDQLTNIPSLLTM